MSKFQHDLNALPKSPNHPKCTGETIYPAESASQRPSMATKIIQNALPPPFLCVIKAEHGHQNHPKCPCATICPAQSAEQRPDTATKIIQNARAQPFVPPKVLNKGQTLTQHSLQNESQMNSFRLVFFALPKWPNLHPT